MPKPPTLQSSSSAVPCQSSLDQERVAVAAVAAIVVLAVAVAAAMLAAIVVLAASRAGNKSSQK